MNNACQGTELREKSLGSMPPHRHQHILSWQLLHLTRIAALLFIILRVFRGSAGSGLSAPMRGFRRAPLSPSSDPDLQLRHHPQLHMPPSACRPPPPPPAPPPRPSPSAATHVIIRIRPGLPGRCPHPHLQLRHHQLLRNVKPKLVRLGARLAGLQVQVLSRWGGGLLELKEGGAS